MAGLTKGGYQAGLVQVSGRLLMLYTIDGEPELQQRAFTFAIMVVYFSIEMFRYPYYALSTKSIDIYMVTWLRYSAWMIFYPSGLLLEAVILAHAIPLYYQSGTYSIKMPNAANIGFNFAYFLAFLIVALPFIARFLLSHMAAQRKKKMAELQKKKA